MNIKSLQIPIIQAPIEATAELTASVSEAGGMGSLQGTWIKPEIAAQIVDSVVSKTNNSFSVNFVLSFEPHSFDAVIEAGAPVITFSWALMQKLSFFSTAGPSSV